MALSRFDDGNFNPATDSDTNLPRRGANWCILMQNGVWLSKRFAPTSTGQAGEGFGEKSKRQFKSGISRPRRDGAAIKRRGEAQVP